MKKIRRKYWIISKLREGWSLKKIAKELNITVKDLLQLLRENKIDYEKIIYDYQKSIVAELQFANYKVVAERHNIPIRHLYYLEKKFNKPKQNQKYYTTKWALKNWIGNLYNK